MLQHVFISYRHESPEHARVVRRLGELLRKAKIPVALDQFHLEDSPGGPDLGWPKWCEDCANQSACVLIIGSEGWFSAYEKTAPSGAGLGAATEADLFRQWLYDGGGDNPRIRLAFLHHVPVQQVPVRLRAWHQFRPFDNDDQLNQLIRWIADRLGLGMVELPTVQWPASVPFQPDLADRTKEEWPATVELLAGRSRERILLYHGPSGVGKSVLVRQAAVYAKRLKIPLVYVDFKGGGPDSASILGQFELELSELLPNFCREGANKVHLLRRDLRALRQPILIIFDTYEHCAGNKTIADWLNQQLFSEVETAPGLAVIVAGQQIPDYRNAGWCDLVKHLPLGPIKEVEPWKIWVEDHYPDVQKKGADLTTLVMVAEGNPGVMSSLCETISKM
jgi:SEFIR domain/ATPase family associated with various cellular activities (AAA)